MQILLKIKIDVIGSDEFDESGNLYRLDENMDEKYGPWTSTYNLRSRRDQCHWHLNATINNNALIQCNVTQWIKEFGKEDIEAMIKELEQSNDR